MDDIALVELPGVGLLGAAMSGDCEASGSLAGDSRLDDDDRERLLGLVADDSLGEYLDHVCSDELLTPVE